MIIGLSCIVLFFIPKSIRYLYANGQYEEGRKCLKNLAEKTKTLLDDDFIDDFEAKLKSQQKGEVTKEKTLTTLDLFRNGHR